MIIFDIGANKGDYTRYLLKKHNYNVKVICVEPNPKLVHTLKNIHKNCVVVNKAVNDTSGEIDFHECSNSNGVSTVSKVFLEKSCFTSSEKIMADGITFKDHYTYIDPIKVKTITLDELIEEHGEPSFIKIDVEGHELETLKSLTKKSCKITFEWHETFIDRIIETIQHLSSLGYEKFGTSIWYSGKDYHNNEITERQYLGADEFIEFLTTKLNDMQDKLNRPNCIERSGMIWVK